jgi:hypothetical protein
MVYKYRLGLTVDTINFNKFKQNACSSFSIIWKFNLLLKMVFWLFLFF